MIDLKKVFKSPTNQQYALELLFPIVGYLFFNWSFLVIVLFYLVDQIGNQVNFFARLHFVQKLHLPKAKWLFPMSVIIFLLLFSAEVWWLFDLFSKEIYDCTESFFIDELIDFLQYEFWLFMPLLILANYFKDKMTFYKTDLPYKESPLKMFAFNVLPITFAFVLIALVYFVWVLLKPDLLWLVILIAFLKLAFEVILLPKLKASIFRKI